mgnify:CR=1 FL=1
MQMLIQPEMIKKQLLSVEDFLTISAQINYLLSARRPCPEAILDKILGSCEVTGSKEAMLEGIKYAILAYANRSRRLGPLAVLHPLRATHLLVLASKTPKVTDILSLFLHDYYEDIYTPDLNQETRLHLDHNFGKVKQHLDEHENWLLEERMKSLTRRDEEEYQEYLGRLLEQSAHFPELTTLKLADRLDNTFDMRIVKQDNHDYFRMIFNSLFLSSGNCLKPKKRSKFHQVDELDEAHRLYQLFKNAIFLTLVRLYRQDREAENKILFDALAAVSLHEAGSILGQLFCYHLTDKLQQRRLLMNVMAYCQAGGIEKLTPSERGHQLDGMFKDRFDHSDKPIRKKKLKEMQEDKEMMVNAALAFLTIFQSFLISPTFQVGGIKPTGLSHNMDDDEQTLTLHISDLGLHFNDD